MLTLEELIAFISLLIVVFELGYKHGKLHRENRSSSKK